MGLWDRVRSYRTSEARQELIMTKKWFLFRWEILLLILLALVVALLNQIPNWVVTPDSNGNIDTISSYPLRDNFAYSLISILVTIAISIFIGIFTQIGNFAGKYGSALFILVPSLAWLLSDRAGDHITEILKTNNAIGSLTFWIVIGTLGVFMLVYVLKHIIASTAMAYRTKLRVEFIYNYASRFLVIIINILIVLTLAYGFVNFGIFSLHLADNTPQQIQDAANAGQNLGPYNLHSELFVAFLAIIAILFALIMVLIGTVGAFQRPTTRIQISENIVLKHQKPIDKRIRIDSSWNTYKGGTNG